MDKKKRTHRVINNALLPFGTCIDKSRSMISINTKQGDVIIEKAIGNTEGKNTQVKQGNIHCNSTSSILHLVAKLQQYCDKVNSSLTGV